MHQFVTFQFWAHALFAFLGAGLLYMQWGRSKLRAYAFSDLLDTFNLTENVRYRMELVIFVLVGTIVALGIARPSTVAQAFSAGLGWTGIAAKPSHNRKNQKRAGGPQ